MKRAETFSGRTASQSEFELKAFISFLKARKVKSYLEIGARHADSFHEIMRHLPPGSRGVAVDLPGALWGRSDSVKSLRSAVNDLNDHGYECCSILGDSKDPEIHRQIVALGPYDAIFIDGDHTLAGVTADWNNFRHQASIIAFHDIAGTGQAEKVKRNPVDVPILWESIKDENSIEFIELNSTMGIGVWISP